MTKRADERRFPGGGGSGRDPRAHEAILRATREMLLESGYARLTIEAVAARAGVGKPTIYRWWRNKAALVHEVITLDPIETEPDTGDSAHDIEQWVRRVIFQMGRPEIVAAYPGVLADRARDESVAAAIARAGESGHAHLRSLIEAGQQAEAIPKQASANELAALLTWLVAGAVTFHGASLRHGEHIDVDRLATRVTDLLLHGLLSRAVAPGTNDASG